MMSLSVYLYFLCVMCILCILFYTNKLCHTSSGHHVMSRIWYLAALQSLCSVLPTAQLATSLLIDAQIQCSFFSNLYDLQKIFC